MPALLHCIVPCSTPCLVCQLHRVDGSCWCDSGMRVPCSGVTSESCAPLCLQDTMEYKKKQRPLKIRMLDGTVKTVMVDDSKTVTDMLMTICARIGERRGLQQWGGGERCHYLMVLGQQQHLCDGWPGSEDVRSVWCSEGDTALHSCVAPGAIFGSRVVLSFDLCSTAGITNYDEYSLVREIMEEKKEEVTGTLKKDKTLLRDEKKMEKLKQKLHTDDECRCLCMTGTGSASAKDSREANRDP